MDYKSILLGIIIGIIVGGAIGFIAAPNTDLSNLEAQVDQLEQQVGSLQNDKIALQASLQEKESEILTLNAHLGQLEGNITELREQVEALSIKANFTFVDVSFSRPEDTSSLLQYWIGNANESIRVMVMVLTQDELAEALIDAHIRGIDVDVIIDNTYVDNTGSDYWKLKSSGIDIMDDNRVGLMHHKVMIIDRHVVVTGSYNWSTTAEDRNDENIIILKSASIAQLYLEEFNRLWAQA